MKDAMQMQQTFFAVLKTLTLHMLWLLIRIALICFYGEIGKIVPELSPNTLLICSTGGRGMGLEKKCIQVGSQQKLNSLYENMT